MSLFSRKAGSNHSSGPEFTAASHPERTMVTGARLGLAIIATAKRSLTLLVATSH